MQEFGPGRVDLLDGLAELYHPDAVFEDPIQRLAGRDAIIHMNRHLLEEARHLEFTMHDAVAGEEVMFLSWTMSFAPKRGPTMSFPGATRLRLREGKIAEHRDYFDLVGGIVDTVPGVSGVYHWMIAKLA